MICRNIFKSHCLDWNIRTFPRKTHRVLHPMVHTGLPMLHTHALPVRNRITTLLCHLSNLLTASRFQGRRGRFSDDFARDVPVAGTAGAFLSDFARDVLVEGTAGAFLSNFARDVPVEGTAGAVSGDFARGVLVEGTARAFLSNFARDVPIAGTAGAVSGDFARGVPVAGTAGADVRAREARMSGRMERRSGPRGSVIGVAFLLKRKIVFLHRPRNELPALFIG